MGRGARFLMELNMFRTLLVLSVLSSGVFMVELTFELSDNAKECFHEEILNETKCTLEFQVVTGGHYDVDVTLKDPTGDVIYDEKKKQYDSHTFTAKTPVWRRSPSHRRYWKPPQSVNPDRNISGTNSRVV